MIAFIMRKNKTRYKPVPSGYMENGHITVKYLRKLVFLDERSNKQYVKLDDKIIEIIREYKNYPKIESKSYLEHKCDNENHKIE